VVASLLALDFPLGPDLENALRRCADSHQAFCILDQRVATSRRAEDLRLLGATRIEDTDGVRDLATGDDVDEDVGLVMLTSGSSGSPKAVVLTWDALRASAKLTQEDLRGEVAPVWYPCLPPNHIGGLAVLLRAILSDGRLLWGDPRDISDAAARGATHVALVRAQLFHHDVTGFEAVLLGGARPPGELPPNVIATWGMTETGSGVVYNGRPLHGVDVTSIDGQICVKSPTMFHSYRDSPRPRIVGPDGSDEWFPTGDAGDVDRGVVRVRGRLGFVINTGGEKIWPDDLEAVLAKVPAVIDVAVTSEEDDEWGERIIALVVSDDVSIDRALQDAAHEAIGPWARPKEIRYVQAIPRTSNGKIRRGDLSELL